ncbi:small basic family protein [Aminipila butyrica]|uniref:Small basic family protein n=1 Tax=Aminipila butyrica TaxID=433296 RepID=A0A858BY13_9FIRM|nr:small basic family protein [Aminipila butyrica]QIB70089.1 small basic family protein [Aminipila butyrica]
MIFAIVIGLAIGLALGFGLDISYPAEYSFYITMGLLAAMDSIVGAARSMMEQKYNNLIFTSGFITNALLAMVLTYVGDKLGVPLYFAAIFVFGGRLFNNLAVLRRLAIERYFEGKQRKNGLKNKQNIED